MDEVKKYITRDGWYTCEHHRINSSDVSNCAVAHVSYKLSAEPMTYHSEVSAIYFITPSSPIA
ncbi:MAG: hypothetical protein IJ789_08840 [Bacteroidales bacterium]|nr:hypothetical protein [Bacteroidales bacterium]